MTDDEIPTYTKFNLINEKIKYVLLNSELVTGYKINTIDGIKIYPVIEPKEYFENCLNNLLINVNSNIFKKRRNIKNRIQFLMNIFNLPFEILFYIASYEFNFDKLKMSIF